MEAQRQARLDAISAAEDAECRQYGTQPGTQTYTECRVIVATQRKNIEAAQEAQRQQNYTNMMIVGGSMIGQ
jgi:hypothetical protein